MLRLVFKFGSLFSLLLLTASCVKDVDFDQAGDLLVTPALEVSLIHFEEPVSRFYDSSGIEQLVVVDSTNVTIFNDDFVSDNLIRAKFLFETTNSINRIFNAKIDFLDTDNQELLVIDFSVPASENNQPQVTIHEEIFENEALVDLKTTTQLVLTLTMQASTDGSILDENSIGLLKMRSKGSFDINLISPE